MVCCELGGPQDRETFLVALGHPTRLRDPHTTYDTPGTFAISITKNVEFIYVLAGFRLQLMDTCSSPTVLAAALAWFGVLSDMYWHHTEGKIFGNRCLICFTIIPLRPSRQAASSFQHHGTPYRSSFLAQGSEMNCGSQEIPKLFMYFVRRTSLAAVPGR